MRYLLVLSLIFAWFSSSFTVYAGTRSIDKDVATDEISQQIHQVPDRIEIFEGAFCDTKSFEINKNSFDGIMYLGECKKFKDVARIRDCEPIGMSISIYWKKLFFIANNLRNEI